MIVQTIMFNNNVVTDELVEPFMCCTSDCDMTSFKTVYLGAIHKLNQTDETAALQLSRIVLANAKKIWVRGTYYRLAHKNYNDVLSGIRAEAINQYLQQIVGGIKRIYPAVPESLNALLLDLDDSLNR